MSEEAQVFRGDRPIEEAEARAATPPRPKTDTIVAKADLPAGEPIGDGAETAAAPAEAFASPDPAAAPPAEVQPAAEPEPELKFEVDPDSLWSMPPAMQERLSNISSAAAVVHQRLDDQEKDTARIGKALKALG